MTRFLTIVFLLFSTNFAWWAWADAWLRRVRAWGGWRLAVAGFALGQATLFVLLMAGRAGRGGIELPEVLLATVYLWYVIVLPAVVVAMLVRGVVRAVVAVVRRVRGSGRPAVGTGDGAVGGAPVAGRGAADGGGVGSRPVENEARPNGTAGNAPRPTRRQILAAAVVAAGPPVVGIAGVATALSSLGAFRVRKVDIAYHGLPAALDGATFAHLSDTHLGRFTTRADALKIAAATNALGVDAVAFTGDLIDFDLNDLPIGLDLFKALTPRDRVVVCEGNHDLFQGREAFERTVRAAGFPLLLNESHTLMVRGYPVQFLGLKWGSPEAARNNAMVDEWAEETLARRRPDAFGVLLAHHPHAFDPAAAAGLPLTLAGHTHGGQLMLTPNLGPGPMLYKYWSGLYRKGQSACVVSNGIGNWFPLRINAPAEIAHIRLSRA